MLNIVRLPKLVLQVFHPDRQPKIILDYLLEAMPRKLKESAYACGLGNEYENGTLCAEKYIGKTGNLDLVIQKGKKKDDGSGETYPDRNSVKGYIFDGVPLPSVPAHQSAELDSDPIPF